MTTAELCIAFFYYEESSWSSFDYQLSMSDKFRAGPCSRGAATQVRKHQDSIIKNYTGIRQEIRTGTRIWDGTPE
jgi:hypothetical protein